MLNYNKIFIRDLFIQSFSPLHKDLLSKHNIGNITGESGELTGLVLEIKDNFYMLLKEFNSDNINILLLFKGEGFKNIELNLPKELLLKDLILYLEKLSLIS
jgi:hypothetical protein